MPDTHINRKGCTVVRDPRGRVVAKFGWGECTIIHADGSSDYYTDGDELVLVCGTVLNPSRLKGKATSVVSVCDRCRHPPESLLHYEEPTHGLCSTKLGYRCESCGEFLCPKHAVACPDGKRRCTSCARKARIRRAVRNIFFKQEG